MIAGIAALVLVAQVETSSVVFTPERGRAYRDEAIHWRGEARKGRKELLEIHRTLDDANARVVELEQRSIESACPEYSQPWSGWPWVSLLIGAGVGAAAAVIILEGPP